MVATYQNTDENKKLCFSCEPKSENIKPFTVPRLVKDGGDQLPLLECHDKVMFEVEGNRPAERDQDLVHAPKTYCGYVVCKEVCKILMNKRSIYC